MYEWSGRTASAQVTVEPSANKSVASRSWWLFRVAQFTSPHQPHLFWCGYSRASKSALCSFGWILWDFWWKAENSNMLFQPDRHWCGEGGSSVQSPPSDLFYWLIAQQCLFELFHGAASFGFSSFLGVLMILFYHLSENWAKVLTFNWNVCTYIT